MWILDTSVERDRVALWGPGGAVQRAPCPPSFLLTLTDPIRHWELLEALDAGYGAEPVTVRTIHDELPGWRVNAGKDVAAAVLRQTDYGAQCYNVDVRRDQQYLAEHRLLPCTGPDEERFSMTLTQDLVVIRARARRRPRPGRSCRGDTVTDGDRTRRLAGDEPTVLGDLFGLVEAIDPNVILFPNADTWTERLVEAAQGTGSRNPLSDRAVRHARLAVVLLVREDVSQAEGDDTRRARADRHGTVVHVPRGWPFRSPRRSADHRALAEPHGSGHARRGVDLLLHPAGALRQGRECRTARRAIV